MKQYISIMKALSDTSRVRALCSLQEGEMCVCQLIELLQLAPSTVSKHLSILQQAGLVDSRKEGRWVYYKLPKRNEAKRIMQETFRMLKNNEIIIKDNKRLNKIRSANPEALCKKVICKN